MIKVKKITIYEKPTSTTCRNVNKILEGKGIDYNKVNYYIEPFTEQKLKSLLRKMNMKPSELLRRREKAAKSIDLKKVSEEKILKLMVSNHDLVERPIIEVGNKAILARPPEKIHELF